MDKKRAFPSLGLILMAVLGLGLCVLAALGAPGCGRVSSTREEIEADLQRAADEAIVVKAKDKNLCLAWITGQTAVRGAEIVAFRCKSLDHVYREAEP
jgi:hypothetical protein